MRLLDLISTAHAQLSKPPNVGLPETELPHLFLQVVNGFLALAAVAALGFIVYGGFLYITSRGDEQQVERAKQVLIYAVVGLVVIAIAAAIVFFVAGMFGGNGGGGPPGGMGNGGSGPSGGDI